MRISDIGTIELRGMEFYAYHGCLPSERKVGNRFVVDFEGKYRLKEAAERDDLGAALNYAAVYELVDREMRKPSDLLENVAGRIAQALSESFPKLLYFRVRVCKRNPPVGGRCEMACICVEGGSEQAR